MSSSLGVPIDPEVHIGLWVNWSYGKVLGRTLTLTQRNGNFLVAFIALFVSFTGTSFFRLTCFALHHILSSKQSEDEIYHQRQAILRNSASGVNALASLSTLWWSHRGQRNREKRLLKRISPLLFHTIITIGAFAIAGIFSSQITALTGDEVLVKSPLKDESIINGSAQETSGVYIPWFSLRINAFASYAQDCYSDAKIKPQACSTLVKSQLPRTIDTNATCPFAPGLCRSSSENIRIDTGLLDSHEDLGINSPETDRFGFRYILQCAPIKTQGYTRQINYSSDTFSLPFSFYLYGGLTTEIPKEKVGNMTFTHMARVLTRDTGMTEKYEYARYSTAHVSAPSLRTSLTSLWAWDPIEGLRGNDSDVTLAFLSSRNIEYSQPVEDPWFAAHQHFATMMIPVDENTTVPMPMYNADEDASPLACATQVQFCFKSKKNSHYCSDLGGLQDNIDINAWNRTLFRFPEPLSEDQSNLTRAFIDKILYATDVTSILSVLGGDVLQARLSMGGSMQMGLPSNQWQLEMTHWSAVILAALQNSILDYATGPSDPRINHFRGRPQNEQEKYLAQRVKIRSTAHANFSVLGLCITFIIGSLILLTEAILECVYVRLLWKDRDFSQYPRLEWCINGTLQLQRLAHEQVGYGRWTCCDEGVPFLEEDGKLAMLDLSDPKHPRLTVNSGDLSESGNSDNGDDSSH